MTGAARHRRSLVEKPRLIKLVGDPRLVREDGFSVPNWKYENNRLIALKGHTTRILRKGDGAVLDPIAFDAMGNPTKWRPREGTGLSREYVWEKSNMSQIIEVPYHDAAIILARCGSEFKDVTDTPHPEAVLNDVIVVKRKKRAETGG
jgi:hypothetical protein